MERIKLYNRDGAELYLVESTDKTWHFEVDKDHDYVIKYISCGRNKENNNVIEFIDPSGGPLLVLGDKIGKYKIHNIISPTQIILKPSE